MSIISSSHAFRQPSINTPRWLKALYARGLSDKTITYFGIQPAGSYLRYPLAPDSEIEHFKALPGQGGAKYLWGKGGKPQAGVKPDRVPFYDPRGELARHVADAGGVLILAEGEPDVWALHEGGIYNATATMLGAGKFYPYHTDMLRALGVTRILIWPDRDEAGLKHAAKLRDLLAETEITLGVRELPADLGDGGDVGTLLLAVGAERLADALMACPPLALPEPVRSVPVRPQTAPTADLPSDASELLEVEARTRAAIAAALVKRGNKPGVFNCPLDHRPEGKDFLFSPEPGSPIGGCMGKHRGQLTRWVDLAEHLGIDVSQIARDVAAERRPVQTSVRRQPRPEPVDYAALRYFPRGIPEALVANRNGYGLGVHLNPWTSIKGARIKQTGALFATLHAYNESVLVGLIDPDVGTTIRELANVNPFGLSERTIRLALSHPAAPDFLTFFYHQERSDGGGKTSKNTSFRGRPAERFVLRPVGEALHRWLGRLREWAWRALLVSEYEDLPAEAISLEDVLAQYGVTLDDIAVIDDVSQPLYEQHDARLREALQALERRMAYMRRSIDADGILAGAYRPLTFPAGTTFSNASEYRDAVDELDPQLRDGVREDRYDAIDRTGRTLAAHRQSAERRGIFSVPVWSEPAPLDPDLPVLPQIARRDKTALVRGRVKLIAADGTELRLSSKLAERENVEAWLDAHGGRAGARVSIWARTIEKRGDLLTEADHAAREEVREQQARARAARKIEKPEKQPTLVDLWVRKQGAMRAALFGLAPMPESSPRVYISQQSGAVFPLSDVWQGVVQQARLIAAEYGEGEWPPVLVDAADIGVTEVPVEQAHEQRHADLDGKRCRRLQQ